MNLIQPDLFNTKQYTKFQDLDDKQKEVISAYAEIISTKQNRPIYSDFIDYFITREMIRSRFGGIEKLHEYMDINHSDVISKHFMTIDTMFAKNLNITDKKHTRYIITTAVADSRPHEGFMKALDKYALENNAQIVIMPCESKTNSFDNKTAVFDKIFSDPKYMFVSEDTPLNSNISLCSIQVSAKQIRPITGLTRLGNREGSFVFASTKQFLEFVPSGNKRGTNYSIMTTGACTLPAYQNNKFVSKRLSYIADQDHLIGAVIIEIQDDRIFHFRQIQADLNGSFIDLGFEYSADEMTTEVLTNIVFGDLHSQNIDENALNSFLDFFAPMVIGAIILHDTFDGYSISHHVTNISEKYMRAYAKKSNLLQELKDTHELITRIEEVLAPYEIVFVKSNHDEFLTRYLQEGRYTQDSENHYAALRIATALFENQDTLKRGFEVATEKDISWNWMFLDRNATYKIAGVECGSHGDLGLNGAKPSLVTLEKVYGNSITGHAHTAAIHRGVFRVGTLSQLDLGYNRGPNSWTQTCCLIYENGQRQLINAIEGKCRA